MANPWFRLYVEFDSDPKVQVLSEPMQRRLIMLFCWKGRGETFHETRAAFHWRITPAELAETKQAFLEAGFIDDAWELQNWNKRQFLSDSSTERVRSHRERLKHDETLQKHQEAVTVTPPDTDTDTETEQIKAKATPPAVTLPAWIPNEAWVAFVEMRRKIRAPLTARAITLTVNTLEKLRASGQDPGAVLDQSVQHSWRGVFEIKNGASNGTHNPQRLTPSEQRAEEKTAILRRFKAQFGTSSGPHGSNR